MGSDSCISCGGDGKLKNAAGNIATCPFCRGTGGAGAFDGWGVRDVTKTKNTTRRSNVVVKPQRPTKPTTVAGELLGELVSKAAVSTDTKAKLISSIIDFELTKGSITETFKKKLMKQIRGVR